MCESRFNSLYFYYVRRLSNVSGTLDNIPQVYQGNEKESKYIFSFQVFELNKPNILSEPCNCKRLKDFVAWDYIKGDNENRTFINDNQTVICKNYSAWQTEVDISGGNKLVKVYSLNGNIGYIFGYGGPPDHGFGKYIDGFRNILSSPPEEKKPSFLTSSIEETSPIEKVNYLLSVLPH